jgi:hypothetical protein
LLAEILNFQGTNPILGMGSFSKFIKKDFSYKCNSSNTLQDISMMFKQLPTMISELNKLGVTLKALDRMNLMSVGVNTGNLDAFRSAIKGLSAEQAVFALASKGATEEQIR